MNIKNVSTKIIGIGQHTLMPDDTAKVGKGILELPAVKAYIEKGFIVVEAEPVAKTGKGAGKKNQDGGDEAPKGADGDGKADTAAAT